MAHRPLLRPGSGEGLDPARPKRAEGRRRHPFPERRRGVRRIVPRLQTTLETLQAHHSNEHVFGASSVHAKEVGGRLGNPEGVGSAVHPVVVRHPRTGRKLLYVNAAFTTHFVGWTVADSIPLLHYLFEHISQERFMYQFRWEEGSIAMWDNRSTWHWALNDYHGKRRLMHRITIEGESLV